MGQRCQDGAKNKVRKKGRENSGVLRFEPVHHTAHLDVLSNHIRHLLSERSSLARLLLQPQGQAVYLGILLSHVPQAALDLSRVQLL